MSPQKAVSLAVEQATAKWGGPDWLPLVVTQRTRQAWDRGWQQWSDAVRTDDYAEQARLAPLIVKALEVMDREADRLGATPLPSRTPEPRGAVNSGRRVA